jgi:hypothetical protein
MKGACVGRCRHAAVSFRSPGVSTRRPGIAGPFYPRLRARGASSNGSSTLYLPSGAADPAWISWTEAWARAPHDAEVSCFLDELMRPWYEDLAEIVQCGVQDGTFGLQVPSGDLMVCFCALLDWLTMIHLNQKPYLPRERLIELAMATARAQLTPAAPRGSP